MSEIFVGSVWQWAMVACRRRRVNGFWVVAAGKENIRVSAIEKILTFF